jgi:predicted lipoprotein with Yx(FWY)xxD motif
MRMGRPGRTSVGRASILVSAAAGVLLATAGLAPVSLAQGGADQLQLVSSGDLGSYLTGADGKTLYYFAKDAVPGDSVCTGKCAAAWPPYLVKKGAAKPTAGDGVTGVISTFKRSDGGRQVTFDGRPLYYFANDAAAGDTNGQGLFGVWFVAAADGSVPTVDSPLAATPSAELGTYLTGQDGRTLYFFKKDTRPGVSTCTSGECLTEWPAYTVNPNTRIVPTADVTGLISTITRKDGSVQVTYDGRPLYYFDKDTQAGQVTGQGKDQFFVALADGSLSSGTAPVASPAASAPAASASAAP